MTWTPSSGRARLELLDALRGFALAGVLLVNLRDFSLYGFLPADARAALATAAWDDRVGALIGALVETKALTIFTVLFGVGFVLQTGRMPVTVYYRRLSGLFVIGMIHSLFWFNDVLRFYAIVGIFLVFTRRIGPWSLGAFGCILAIFPWHSFHPALSNTDDVVQSTLLAFRSPDFGQVVKANLRYDAWLRVTQWGLALSFLGRFLIGVMLARMNVLADPSAHQQFWRRLLVLGLLLGGGGALLLQFGPVGRIPRVAESIVHEAASLFLALSYLAAFVLLFQRPRLRRWLRALAPVGRIALTNYLLQTAAGIVLFFGVGFGIGPRFGLVGLPVFFLVIFGAQMAMSWWWLKRFRFGPVEWLWRCFTYGRWLELRTSTA